MDVKKYIGHHGTDLDNKEQIMREKFIINKKHRGSLGTGIYFFENNCALAKEYSENRNKGQIICVIESTIEVPIDKIFDTKDNKEDQKTFHVFREEYKKRLLVDKRNMRTRNVNSFDGGIYDVIADIKGLVLMRANTFTRSLSDRELNVPSSNVSNGIELCVKRSNVIKDKIVVENSPKEDL